jgi:hypothetical protein
MAFKLKSPLTCWEGYERVPGTKKGAPRSCRKASPISKKMGDFKESDVNLKSYQLKS